MAYQLYQTVAFGSSKAGLITVGYTLYASDGSVAAARVATGIQDLGGGQYGALVTIPPGFVGRITWDTGEATPATASASINPGDAETDSNIFALVSKTTGGGSVLVDHNYGGPDNLAYRTATGQGIVGATILAYITSDYTAGRTDSTYVVGRTVTIESGRWQLPLSLDPGDYTLVCVLPNVYGPNSTNITVS
jgi:hypothetical protein